MATTPNYDIDYKDERLTNITNEGDKLATETEQTYNGMINESDNYFNNLKDATQQWADKQSQIQQEQTDFTIEQIEQQKEQAQKDYTKEQAGAYVDWRKQSNQYGTEAEKMASAGLSKTGYSESSQVSMYNTYQNRVATARESYNQAVLNYNNAIKDARLQNNAALAEIAYNALQKQLELSLQGFQYKNQLISEMTDKKMQVKQFTADQYWKQLDQLNNEMNRKWQTDQNALDREFQSTQAELDRQFQAKQAEIERQYKSEEAELDRKHEKKMIEAKTEAEKELLKEQHKNDLAKLAKQQEYELAQLDKELANQKSLLAYQNSLNQTTFSGGSGGSAASGSGRAGIGNNNKYAVTFDETSNLSAVKTAYFQGAMNPDGLKYGTFSNGYQPKGISGHGKLSKSGDTIDVKTEVKYGVDKGKKQTLVQTVWRAEDGTLWYWEGRENKYKQVW